MVHQPASAPRKDAISALLMLTRILPLHRRTMMPLLLLHYASGYSRDDVPTDPHPLYPQAYQHHATLPVIRSYVSNTVVRRCNRICNAVEHGAFRAGVEYEGWIVGRRGKQQRRGVTTDSMAICVHTARPAVGRMPCPASAATACFFLLSFPSLFPKLELVLSLLSSLSSLSSLFSVLWCTVPAVSNWQAACKRATLC